MTAQETLTKYAGSVSAASRHLATFTGGIVCALGFANVSPDNAKALVQAIQDALGGLSSFLTAIGPLAGIVAAWYAARKATPATPAEKVKSAGALPGVDIKVDTTVAAPEVTAVALDKKENNVNPKGTP
jgi:hypothetical protein